MRQPNGSGHIEEEFTAAATSALRADESTGAGGGRGAGSGLGTKSRTLLRPGTLESRSRYSQGYSELDVVQANRGISAGCYRNGDV